MLTLCLLFYHALDVLLCLFFDRWVESENWNMSWDCGVSHGWFWLAPKEKSVDFHFQPMYIKHLDLCSEKTRAKEHSLGARVSIHTVCVRNIQSSLCFKTEVEGKVIYFSNYGNCQKAQIFWLGLWPIPRRLMCLSKWIKTDMAKVHLLKLNKTWVWLWTVERTFRQKVNVQGFSN